MGGPVRLGRIVIGGIKHVADAFGQPQVINTAGSRDFTGVHALQRRAVLDLRDNGLGNAHGVSQLSLGESRVMAGCLEALREIHNKHCISGLMVLQIK